MRRCCSSRKWFLWANRNQIGGSSLVDEGAANLKTLADKLDTTKMKKPSFLMVLTGVGDYAYKRPGDGVLVVPIGCLKD